MADVVSIQTTEKVATIRVDDGKANALGTDVIAAIDAALGEAEKKNLAVVLTGRPGFLSGGFDLAVMGEGGEAGCVMVEAGGRLSLRLGRHPAPVVVACSGHAVAMGAILLLSADLRIGARGKYKIGFNEVAIGTATPNFLIEQARERMSKRHFVRATVQSQIYDPESAVDAGLLDDLVDEDRLLEVAQGEAERLADLPRQPFVDTRRRARGEVLDRIERLIGSDVRGLFGMTDAS